MYKRHTRQAPEGKELPTRSDKTTTTHKQRPRKTQKPATHKGRAINKADKAKAKTSRWPPNFGGAFLHAQSLLTTWTRQKQCPARRPKFGCVR